MRVAAFLTLFHAASAANAALSVRCCRQSNMGLVSDPWRVSGVDAACPVSVFFTEFSGTFAPGDAVPMLWSVQLKPPELTTNAIFMPLPPTKAIRTYVRTCTGDADACGLETIPGGTTTSSALGNFSSSGEAHFSSLEGLTFDTEGMYTIGAIATIQDPVDLTLEYVFAGYTTVNITGPKSNTTTHEKGVVRCRMSRQSALNETLDASTSVSESTNCEVGIKLLPLEVTRPESAVVVAWTATLNQRDDADIHMPSPLSSEEINGTRYEIVRSSLSLCKSEKLCDEYTAADDMQEVLLTGPASFSSANKVSFVAPPVALPSAGWHVAMIHLVVAGPSRRYDIVYYLELLATETDLAQTVDTATYVADTNTSYCWQVLADGTEANVSSSSVAAAAQDTECPYTSSLSISSATVEANKTLDLSWNVDVLGRWDRVDITLVFKYAGRAWTSRPGFHLYACSVGTVCTPFSANKTLVFSASAYDLGRDPQATIDAPGVRFPLTPGNYTLMAHTVFPNGVSRMDIASFANVTVSAATAVAAPAEAAPTTHTTAYVLVSVGSTAGVAVIFIGVVWFRKRHHRHHRPQTDRTMVPVDAFRVPSRPQTMLKTTADTTLEPYNHCGSFGFTMAEPSTLSLSIDDDEGGFHQLSVRDSDLSFTFSVGERSTEN